MNNLKLIVESESIKLDGNVSPFDSHDQLCSEIEHLLELAERLVNSPTTTSKIRRGELINLKRGLDKMRAGFEKLDKTRVAYRIKIEPVEADESFPFNEAK